MNVENSSPRGFDWGCIWNPWQRTLLLFFVGLCPAPGQTHLAEGGLMWSADASLAGNSLLGWQCLLLDYVSSCFDMAQLRIMCSSHSLFLPAVALFFSSKDFLADLQSLTLSEPETLQITHKVLPAQSAGIADRYELFHLSNPQHTCSHSGWVSGDFRVLKVSVELHIIQVCESENAARPFLRADRECQDLCLPTSIHHSLVCPKTLLFFINSFICKRPGSSCCLCCHIPGSPRLID